MRPAQALRRLRRRGRLTEEQVVWLLGSPRSGSTWLWQMLAAHSRVLPVNEPLIGLYLTPFLSDLPGASADAVDPAAFSVRLTARDHPHQFFADQYRDVWAPGLGELMRRRFEAQAVRHGHAGRLRDLVVVVKEPNGSQSADLLLAAQPRARLLFLLRDGRDVVASEVAANAPGSWVSTSFTGMTGVQSDERLDFVVQSAHKWAWRTRTVQAAFEQHAGPKLRVRYEDLVSDPRSGLREVVDWLGLPMDDGELTDVVAAHDFGAIPEGERGPRSFYRSATPGSWRTDLTAEEQERVTDVLGPLLRETGYLQ